MDGRAQCWLERRGIVVLIDSGVIVVVVVAAGCAALQVAGDCRAFDASLKLKMARDYPTTTATAHTHLTPKQQYW